MTANFQIRVFGHMAPKILKSTLFIVNCSDCLSAEFVGHASTPYNNIYYYYYYYYCQLCITLNNISHVSGYISELQTLLHWDMVAQQLSIKHENEAVGQTALRSLAGLVAATNDDLKERSRILSQQIIEKIVVDLRKYTYAFTRCHNDLPSVSIENRYSPYSG